MMRERIRNRFFRLHDAYGVHRIRKNDTRFQRSAQLRKYKGRILVSLTPNPTIDHKAHSMHNVQRAPAYGAYPERPHATSCGAACVGETHIRDHPRFIRG
jgi:hypothetical protein